MSTPVSGLPVGTVTVSGSDVTVSQLLNNPRLIEQRLGEATALDYFADRILPNVGAPGGGVVIYEEWSPSMAVLDRKAEALAPDAEVPLAGTTEGDFKVAKVEADGLGYTVSRDQENRNQRFVVDRKERGLANNIALKFNARAVAVVKAAITAGSRTMAAFDWSAVVTGGDDPTPRASWPHSQIELLKARQRQNRVPFMYDVLLAHALDVWRLTTIYQGDAPQAPTLSELARRIGVREIIADNTGDIEHGKPILVASGGAGGTVWEQPIMTEVIPEPRRRRKVVQSTGTAGYFVDNAYALMQLTGVAAADITAGLV